ncbi:hypothetical protein SDC9_06403 [bioreactor metagenome]|uniref:Uncharacterized protein n=1 Tax=bioreactor metagenome TaxID=1076179 RepID=A0A644T4J1_9ZZZZ
MDPDAPLLNAHIRVSPRLCKGAVSAPHPVHRRDQRRGDAGLAQRVAGGGHQAQLGPVPALCQPPGRDRRADHVHPPLHDHRRDLFDAAAVAQDLAVFLEEGAMAEIMVLEAGEGAGVIGRGLAREPVVIHRGKGVFPHRPVPAEARLLGVIAREQPLVIGRDQVAAFVFRDRPGEALPQIGEELPRAAAIEPVELAAHGKEDPAQHQRIDPLGVGFGVKQRQRRAPAAAEDDPAAQPEREADLLHVGDQIPAGVPCHRGMRARQTAAALVEKNHPIMRRIKEPPHRRAASAPRPAMAHHHRAPLRMARLLDIDPMAIAHVEHALVEGLDRRVEKGAGCAFLPCVSIHNPTI